MTDGLFLPGTGFYYRVDPRVKLVLTLLLMIALFSATSFVRPLLILFAWLLFAGLNRSKLKQLWRFARLLRWLLLFTLLMHLFLTPGRTLWGSSIASLDGLLQGLLIDLQLLLAGCLSLLLAWTTRPVAIAKGGASLLAPLQFFRVPVREIADLVPLVLYFIPSLQEEVKILKAGNGQEDRLASAWQRWREMLEQLIGGMLDRADSLSRQIACGRDPVSGAMSREELAFDHSSRVFAGAGAVFIVALFFV